MQQCLQIRVLREFERTFVRGKSVSFSWHKRPGTTYGGQCLDEMNKDALWNEIAWKLRWRMFGVVDVKQCQFLC
jgi:hypothetical protein